MELPHAFRTDRLGPLTIPLHGLHAMALSHGEEQFARKGKCPPTFLLAVGFDVIWVEESWESSDERGFKFQLMREVIRVLNVRAYSFISEVYIAAASKADWERDGPPTDLYKLPKNKRDESLWIDSWSRQGEHFTSNYLITPRRTGLAFLGPRVDEVYKDYDEFIGRAVNLFQPPREAP